MSRTSRKNKLVTPFVKWVGGKRQLIDQINEHVPSSFSHYFEPFVGGGAVLFHLQPKRATINDSNSELINLYKVIQQHPTLLIEDLKKHINESDYFYEIRSLDRNKEVYSNLSDIEKASRIIFLNKTCYNGLFRVNSAGEFNSPFGKYKNPNIVNEITITAVNSYLSQNNINILNTDFESAVKDADKNAFVYFDPPYDPVSNSANFTGYTKGGFDRNEQIRLRNVCDRLNSIGAKFLLSNSSTEFIHDLYQNYKISTVNAMRAINSKADKRGKVPEVLIKNYE